ncbi:MAG: hypothetical protein KDA22_12405 [Phycisphaerales bacterium]|nr:hypothetical protein [Phycisphaerales bacterium]
MATTLDARRSHELIERPESSTHHLAHWATLVLWPLMVLMIAASVLAMATIFPLSVVTGGLAVVCGVLLWTARKVEDGTEAGTENAAAERQSAEPPASVADRAAGVETEVVESSMPDDQVLGPTMSSSLLLREGRVIAGGVVVLALIAVLLGFLILEWPFAALGTGIVFLYMGIVGIPAWMAWIEGDVETAVRREHDGGTVE